MEVLVLVKIWRKDSKDTCTSIKSVAPSFLQLNVTSKLTSSNESLRAATSLQRSFASCCAAARAADALLPPLDDDDDEEEDWAIACSRACASWASAWAFLASDAAAA